MRFRTLLVAVFALALAVPAMAGAQEAPYLVTGGGQVIASSGDAGPGDTIAFVAGLRNDAAYGRIAAVGTSAAGEEMPIYQGNVTCVEPGGESNARFGGTVRDPRTGETFNYTVDVTDTGDENRGTDTVVFQETDEPCEDDGRQIFGETTLARGNVKVDTANSGS